MRVAINGFGRIGRLAARLILSGEFEGMELVGINSRSDKDMLCHLLKYDSTQGRFNKDVSFEEIEEGNKKEGYFVVDGKKVRLFAQDDPETIPWNTLDVDIVLECSGVFKTYEKASKHIKAGAKKVLVSAPGKEMKMVVYNVNDNILTKDDVVVSAASCTTNCLAPMAKVLHDKFTIKQGIMTTIHAYTKDQNTLDGPHRKGNFRRARAAAVSIVPASTGAAKAMGEVIPDLKGKLDGSAQRVPVPCGSLTELTSILDKKVTVEEINKAMKEAANETLGYTEDEIVSADVIGIKVGSLFDATQTNIVEANGVQLVKTVAWYDNEMGYTYQLLRTAKAMFR